MPTIDVLCPVGDGCFELALLMKETAERTKSGKYSLQWHLATITHKPLDSWVAQAMSDRGFDLVVQMSRNERGGSFAHADALTEGIRQMRNPYLLVVDSDVAFLHRDWDITLMSHLKKKTAIVGCPYPNNTKHTKQCYQRFPSLVCALFDTHVLKKLDIDLQPGKRGKRFIRKRIMDKQNERWFRRPRGSRVVKEMGWRLPLAYKVKGYGGYSLDFVASDSSNRQFPFADKKQRAWFDKHKGYKGADEYHYKGRLMFVHWKGARNTSFGEMSGKVWFNRINLCLKEKYDIEVDQEHVLLPAKANVASPN